MLTLNLGSGRLPISGAVNIDTIPFPGVDYCMDINNIDIEFAKGSVDGIYMLHVLEHLPNPYEFIGKCWDILKPGGFLYIQVPHCSGVTGIGDFGHYRTFNYSSLSDYLCNETYVSRGKLWKCVRQEIHWYKINNNKHPFIKFKNKQAESKFAPYVYWADKVITRLINLSPQAFERGWCHLVSGADEVLWIGRKIA
jgi:SAM-dependent methyltransferase